MGLVDSYALFSPHHAAWAPNAEYVLFAARHVTSKNPFLKQTHQIPLRCVVRDGVLAGCASDEVDARLGF
jgi:hypothetical protein